MTLIDSAHVRAGQEVIHPLLERITECLELNTSLISSLWRYFPAYCESWPAQTERKHIEPNVKVHLRAQVEM